MDHNLYVLFFSHFPFPLSLFLILILYNPIIEAERRRWAAEERFRQEAMALEQRRIEAEKVLRQEAEERAIKAAALAEDHQKRRDAEAAIAMEQMKAGQSLPLIHCVTFLICASPLQSTLCTLGHRFHRLL